MPKLELTFKKSSVPSNVICAADAASAAASAAAAAASYDSFDDRYLGAKASAPTYGGATAAGNGNMIIDSNGDIWIYVF